MVTVNIRRTPFGYDYIKAENHAGDPLVCAAVSAIVQGLAGTLLNIEPRPKIIKLDLSNGNAEIEISPMLADQDRSIIDALFLFALISLMQIEKAEPSKIQVFDTY